MPLQVSVIVLVCDRTMFLRQALTSVALQSFENIEVLVSDCSTTGANSEACAGLVAAVGVEFPSLRLRYIRQPTPLKQGPHQRAAIEQAVGMYIALLDDDDWWFEGHLRRSVAWLEQSAKNGLTTSNSLTVNAEGAPLGPAKNPTDEIPSESNPKGWLNYFLRSWYGSTSGIVVRREALREHSYYDTSCVDLHMVISTLLSGYLVKGFKDPSYYYRVHDKSFYTKGPKVLLDRHQLRRRLWQEHGFRMVLASPMFPLLLLKSILEPPVIAWRLKRAKLLEKHRD